MTTEQYRQTLEAAIEEYERLKQEREAIETRLAQLRQTIGALGPLCKLPRRDVPGLTDACRSVLRAKLGGLMPLEVKAGLETMGLDLSTYSNPLASIHAVLKRLAKAGEVLKLKNRQKKTLYVWKHPAFPVAITDGQGKLLSVGPGMARWLPLLPLLASPAPPTKPPKKKRER